MPDEAKMNIPELCPDTVSAVKGRNSAPTVLQRADSYRTLEIASVVFAVTLTLGLLKSHNPALSHLNPFFSGNLNWFFVPAILLAAAVIPTKIKKQKLSEIGFNLTNPGLSIKLVCCVCLITFPLVLLGWLVLEWFGYHPLLYQLMPIKQTWLSFIFYQFMYVAVAEEVFFRGYVQTNISQLVKASFFPRTDKHIWPVIVLSAGVFALAHIIVKGQIIAGLTFVPGLVLAWLFHRSRSLIAPVLFHGLANIYWLSLFRTLA